MASFTYKSYNFVDKDPIIDYIRTVINDSHLSLTKIADESGVNQNTISNWLYGKTKRPQAASINAVLRVCNYKLSVIKMEVPEIVYPTSFQPKPVKPQSFKPTTYKPVSIKPQIKNESDKYDRTIAKIRYQRKIKAAKRRGK